MIDRIINSQLWESELWKKWGPIVVWFQRKIDENCLVVSTHLKNISQTGNLPQLGLKIRKSLKPTPRCVSPTLFLMYQFAWRVFLCEKPRHHISRGHTTQRLKCFRNGLAQPFGDHGWLRRVSEMFKKLGIQGPFSRMIRLQNIFFEQMWHWNPFKSRNVLGTWIGSKLFETFALCHKLACHFQQNSSIVLAASSFDDAN